MPRVRRKSKLRREGLTKQDFRFLLTGSAFVRPFALEGDPVTQRGLWNELRDDLLPVWIEKHPGTRPWSWWRWDAVERRERVDGGLHPFDDPTRLNDPHTTSVYYGIPAVQVRREDAGIVYESQKAYLHRLGLLEPSEFDAPDHPDWPRPDWRLVYDVLAGDDDA